MEYRGYKISLNLIAKRCHNGKKSVRHTTADGVEIPALPDFEINFTEYDPYDEGN